MELRVATINGSGQLVKLICLLNKMKIIKFDKITDRFSITELSKFCARHSRKMVVVVGSNPSKQSPDCTPFHKKTKSRQSVDKWLEGINCEIIYMNIVDYKTESNKPLRLSQINVVETRNKFTKLTEYQYCKIISCGDLADKALKAAKIVHFAMPHPSGLCRFWNDKEASEAKIKEMLLWLNL